MYTFRMMQVTVNITTKPKVKVTYTYSSDSEGSRDGVSPRKKSKVEQKQGKNKGGSSKGRVSSPITLLFAPSVLSNWIDQFEQHVRPSVKLSVYLYYSSDRSRDPSILSSKDIVLTTYNVLAADFGVATGNCQPELASKINGRPVMELPEQKVFIQHIALSKEEKQLYESVRKEGRTVTGRCFSEGTVLTNYTEVLAILVRLRQLCCHRLFGSSATTVDSKGLFGHLSSDK